MHVAVLLSETLIPSDVCNVFILLGQRSVAGTDSTHERTVCVVCDAIPCEDLAVIAEQAECMEQVLPCGIVFLGIFLFGDGIKEFSDLRRSFKNHLQRTLLFVAMHDAKGMINCQLLQSGKAVPLISPETNPMFVTMACYFKSPLEDLPFIVKSRCDTVADGVVINVNSTHVFECSEIWSSGDNLYAMQLGSASGVGENMMCVHVTFAPSFSCGRDIFLAICSLLPRIKEQPHGVMVRVLSRRNPALVYQWVFTPVEKGLLNPSKAQWSDLKDLIEDGFGERVRSSHMVEDAFGGSPGLSIKSKKANKKVVVKEQATEAPTNILQPEWENVTLFRCVFIVAIVFIAVLLAFFWKL